MKDNRCRLCRKLFCCKNCRFEHEEKVHELNPQCDICVYGRVLLSELPLNLLSHVKNCHWPLHCVFCDKIFDSVEQLTEHDRCPMAYLQTADNSSNMDNKKTPTTPITPITADQNNLLMVPSLMITPMNKNLGGLGGHQMGLTITMGVTSTPMTGGVHIINTSDAKATSMEQISEIKSVLKISSCSVNESKKRVTFSDNTPIMEPSKYNRKFKRFVNESHDQDDSDLSNKENEEQNQIVAYNVSRVVDTTIWETALDTSDSSQKCIECFDNSSNQLATLDVPSRDLSNGGGGIWTSMTRMVKSMVENIPTIGLKRQQSDELDAPKLKRMKYSEIKCRPTIRAIEPRYTFQLAERKKQFVDKATQTDESDFD